MAGNRECPVFAPSRERGAPERFVNADKSEISVRPIGVMPGIGKVVGEDEDDEDDEDENDEDENEDEDEDL